MRAEHPSLVGRDHLSFRSYYLPVKVGATAHTSPFPTPHISPTPHIPSTLPFTPPSPQSTIDGDLCELYNSLDTSKKREIAEDLDRTPNEVCYWSYKLL